MTEAQQKVKARSTIRRRIQQLRRFIKDPQTDPVAKRVAQSLEDSLRWVTEDVRGWPHPATDALITARLIRNDQLAREVPE